MENRSTIITRHWGRPVVLLALLLGFSALIQAHQDKGRPSVKLRVNPALVFAPARIVATAEISGGANDYQDFYCAKIEWTWDDGTTSEAQDDCDPYEAGKSQIRRRYTNEHTFQMPGQYNVRFSLKQGTKTVGSGAITVEIRGLDAHR